MKQRRNSNTHARASLHRFPERLRRSRRSRRLSRRQLARRAELAETILRRYEQAAQRPTLASVERLLSALEVAWEELVSPRPPAPTPPGPALLLALVALCWPRSSD